MSKQKMRHQISTSKATKEGRPLNQYTPQATRSVWDGSSGTVLDQSNEADFVSMSPVEAQDLTASQWTSAYPSLEEDNNNDAEQRSSECAVAADDPQRKAKKANGFNSVDDDNNNNNIPNDVYYEMHPEERPENKDSLQESDPWSSQMEEEYEDGVVLEEDDPKKKYKNLNKGFDHVKSAVDTSGTLLGDARVTVAQDGTAWAAEQAAAEQAANNPNTNYQDNPTKSFGDATTQVMGGLGLGQNLMGTIDSGRTLRAAQQDLNSDDAITQEEGRDKQRQGGEGMVSNPISAFGNVGKVANVPVLKEVGQILEGLKKGIVNGSDAVKFQNRAKAAHVVQERAGQGHTLGGTARALGDASRNTRNEKISNTVEGGLDTAAGAVRLAGNFEPTAKVAGLALQAVASAYGVGNDIVQGAVRGQRGNRLRARQHQASHAAPDGSDREAMKELLQTDLGLASANLVRQAEEGDDDEREMVHHLTTDALGCRSDTADALGSGTARIDQIDRLVERRTGQDIRPETVGGEIKKRLKKRVPKFVWSLYKKGKKAVKKRRADRPRENLLEKVQLRKEQAREQAAQRVEISGPTDVERQPETPEIAWQREAARAIRLGRKDEEELRRDNAPQDEIDRVWERIEERFAEEFGDVIDGVSIHSVRPDDTLEGPRNFHELMAFRARRLLKDLGPEKFAAQATEVEKRIVARDRVRKMREKEDEVQSPEGKGKEEEPVESKEVDTDGSKELDSVLVKAEEESETLEVQEEEDDLSAILDELLNSGSKTPESDQEEESTQSDEEEESSASDSM